jgi:hypothetical protein
MESRSYRRRTVNLGLKPGLAPLKFVEFRLQTRRAEALRDRLDQTVELAVRPAMDLSPTRFSALSIRLLTLLQRPADTPAIAGVTFASLARS